MQHSPFPWRKAAFVAALVCVFSGPLIGSGEQKGSGVPANADRATIAHVLNRVAFGARPGDVTRVQSMGLAAYIDQQLHPERIDDAALESRLAEFETLNLSTRELSEKYFAPAQMLQRNQQAAAARQAPPQAMTTPPPGNGGDQNDMMMPGTPSPAAPGQQPPNNVSPELRQARQAAQTVLTDLMQAKMLRATLSGRQLEEVLTDFWFNHFNVSMTKNQVREFLTSYERDTIRPHVFGRFRDLLGAVAHSPAMLFYLDNWQSAGPNTPPLRPQAMERLNDPRIGPQQRQQMLQRLEQVRPQGNRQARGLNENYAREIMELHTLGVDGGYTQKDVTELARILTGWTIDRPQQGGDYIFRPQMHDQGTKTLLGVTFHDEGEREGEKALDLLASHPATAHHIAYQLSQRFVADEPPASLVNRAAKAFTETKGDLREVVRVIITSPEFFAADAYRAKVKTPLEFVVSAVRATGATVSTSQPLVAALRNLGMPLYSCEPPTGYSMTADAWVNTGSLLNRMNFAVQLMAGGRITPDQGPGRGAGAGRPLPPNGQDFGPANGRGRGAFDPRRPLMARGPIAVDVQSLAPDTTDEARDRLIDQLLAGQASAATRQTLARADTPQTLIALTLGSPEFQRR